MGLGVGGYSYANLASGQTPYTNLTNAITGAVALMPSGFALNIPAVMYVQGEADTTTTRSTYATDLATMQSNLSTTIKTATPAGTGQSNTPFMLITQQTDDGGFTTDTQTQAIIGAQSDASYPNSTTIYLVTPLYPFENNAQQSGHLTARGYYQMGEKMAEAYHQIVPAAEGGLNNTTTWYAPRPTAASITRSTNVVTIPFTGGVSPYVLDCSVVSSPNGSCDGFYYTDTSGSPPTCSSVAIASNGTSLQMTLSGTPTGGSTGTIEYANSVAHGEGTPVPGPATGIRGCFHDSDTYVSLLDGKVLPNYGIAFSVTYTN
jgi:hypothetical protein